MTREEIIKEIFEIMPDDMNYLETLSMNELIERLKFFRSIKKSAEKFLNKKSVR